MGEIVLPPLLSSEQYEEVEGKFASSLRWLILRVYEQESAIPDKLRNGIGIFRDDEGRLHVDMAVLSGLNNGSLYAQAAAKIFKEPNLVGKSHGQVLAALMDYGIDVVQRADEGGLPVTEDELLASDPFIYYPHLAMIDALMNAHMRNNITVERVVEAVSRHTHVDDRERPMDATDALLFWINKICLLLRDEVDQSQVQLKGADDGGMIPEMEDLYDEISDGQCLCALVAFYRQTEMNIQDICFMEVMTTPNCQYNLLLLREFCRNCLPWNPFHMEIEDILYLHDSLQMNINIFLADLFDIFEPAIIRPPMPEIAQSPRRFIPIQGIPDLRAANQAARSPHPPRVRNPFSNVHVSQSPARSMSMMSNDSLMSTRFSRRDNQLPQDKWGENVTNFGKLNQMNSGSNGNISQSGGGYTRSDSLPAASVRLALEEKRREHEKRKLFQNTASEAERAEKSKAAFFALMNQAKPKQDAESVMSEEQRKMIEMMSQKIGALEDKISAMNMERREMSRALSQPSVYQDMSAPHSDMPDYGTLPNGQLHHMALSGSYQQPSYDHQFGYRSYQPAGGSPYAQPQLRSSLSNGMINYLPGQVPYDYQQTMPNQGSPMYSGNASDHLAYGGQQHQQSPFGAGMLPHHQANQQAGFTLMHQSAHASTGFPMHPPPPSSQHLQQTPLASYGQQPPSGYPPTASTISSVDLSPSHMSFDCTAQSIHSHAVPPHLMDSINTISQQQGLGPAEHPTPAGFVLHNQDAQSSRFDPQLELNRNLTNWGMTMKTGGRPQRRQWENQTFVKNDMDLVSHPDMVPVIDSEDLPQQRRSPLSAVGSAFTSTRRSREDPSVTVAAAHEMQRLQMEVEGAGMQQASPPRDPGSNGHQNGNGAADTSSRSSTHPPLQGPAFVVTDDQAAEDFDKIAEQRREAKKAALLAKTMKRREEKDDKLDLLEQRNMERRLAEDAKKEMMEQRKIEKEIQRQKILDEYKRKKVEKEMGLEPSSARGAPSSARGHSQPPFVRAKSQMSEAAMSSGRTPRSRGASTVEQRVSVASLQEPTHKLYAKVAMKTNRSQIINALQYSVFPGKVNDDVRTKATGDLAKSAAKHFLILFRDHKCQYRGLYSWDQQSDTAEKVSGTGPSKCSEEMMNLMFKYDCGSKGFSQIPCKSLGATIDGFSIQDRFWQKPKIPHSSSGSGAAAAHRNN